MTRAAISRQIKTLLQRQYVYQEPDHGDRRRMLLHLTERGMEIEAIVTERVQLRFDGWVEVFGEVKAREILTFIQAFDAKVVSRSKTYAHQYE
ncbi:DNA-binding MarR family transcriptional regulator [Weissella uvarum]|uniref:hypothetical protein n=1 Tax=Weissella uvarum TaxID=1479233 RepID=UPI0030B8302F|nr:DNA-binding MarR family transcriptional regulator [Weissella uvarum]